jgi:hypothetical protein
MRLRQLYSRFCLLLSYIVYSRFVQNLIFGKSLRLGLARTGAEGVEDARAEGGKLELGWIAILTLVVKES